MKELERIMSILGLISMVGASAAIVVGLFTVDRDADARLDTWRTASFAASAAYFAAAAYIRIRRTTQEPQR